MKVRSLLPLFLFSFLTISVFAQEAQLAQQYFRDGEYEKAAVLYEKLYNKNTRNDFFFDRYVECLLAMEDFKRGETVIKQQLRKTPEKVNLYVTYGKLLERQFKDEEAKKMYAAAIENLPKEQYRITRLANSFLSLTKYEEAIATYEKGAQLLRDKRIFSYNLGDLYRRKGDVPKMITNYLNSLEDRPERLNNMKTIFQRYLLEEDYKELQRQLYERLQKSENAIHLSEMLTWVFIQRKDYKNAFRQVKALDRRFGENGGRIYRLARIASNDKDYDAAIAAYDYIVESKGLASTFYIDAKREALRCRRSKLVEGYSYTEEDLRVLETQYESFLNEFGRSRATAGIVLELAELQAFYLNDLDKAIQILNELINFPGIDRIVQANGKLSLADFYLMKGEVWESTLLYSQVDKAFKEDLLGHEARFRNAKLSYFNGDFQWAQTQFDILKASTSRLIANDALDLSVFIMDNLGLDTSATALITYSQAELLVFQNRFQEAFDKMDSLLVAFPDHSLQDDVLYLKANVYKKKRNFEKAAELYETIVEKYKEEIRADNSLFALAELYETQLNDIEKAKTLYETLFIDFSGSTFAVEARKRFRRLRGDNI
ncbi:MAG: tetratricopeptide repeat protein [Saprospiraceae bacterium]|nr:tetratricopeptide repeat protein [Saprospiraceae bacterium]